jgi:P27 family predicted phage terminase small subunit
MPQPTPIRSAKPVPPAYLATEEAALFTQVVRDFPFDEVRLRILAEGCASLQRAREARETVDRDGMTVRDAKGQLKAHPLLTVERDARAAALAAFRQLNLETPKALTKRSSW